jgi:hypothetical protein
MAASTFTTPNIVIDKSAFTVSSLSSRSGDRDYWLQ